MAIDRSLELALMRNLPSCRRAGTQRLQDAVEYALFPGGKRLRPMLSVLSAQVFSTDLEAALPAACAVEFVHTSSLIFDDLPCMDDSATRRAKPALHRIFGEDVALLTGIALLNQAYAIFGKRSALMAEATECIGVNGMIGGQVLDLSPCTEPAGILTDRNRKTSAMMRLAFTAGPLGSGCAVDDVGPLATAGEYLGEAYQIGDDLLDETSVSEGIERLNWLLQLSRELLQNAYGVKRVSPLLTFIDAIFASMPQEALAAGCS